MKSIKTKGSIFVFSILLIVIVFMLSVSHILIKNWAINELKNRTMETSKTFEYQVEKYLDEYISPIKKLAETPEIQSMDWEKQQNIIKQQMTLEYLTLAIVDKNGLAIYPDDSILDLSDRDYIKKSLNGEFNISPVIISRVTQEPVMMIGQPIYNKSKVVGSIIARIEPYFLKDFINSWNNELYSIYFILDDKGNVILHSNEKYQLEKLNFLTFQEELFDFKNLKNTISKSYESPEGFGTYIKNDKKVILSYSTIDILNWRFYLGFYERNILDTLSELDFIFILISVFLIIISVIIAYFITKSFTNPVIELSTLFKKASEGDLTVRSSYKKDDELGEASKSFNKMMSRMKTLVYFDPVTNLPNQQVLDNDFKVLKTIKAEKKYIAIIEISNFSKINELYGYQIGDQTLKTISIRINDVLDSNDKLYRGKGDQFILLTKSDNFQEINFKCQNIINKISESMIIKKDQIFLKGRVGISEFPKNGKSIEILIKKAIFASNYLKKKGNGSIQFFKEDLHDKDLKIRSLIIKLEKALDNNKMYLNYQPIYNLKTMSLEGMETLIRWEDEERGLISPGEFIPIAERNGLIKKLDQWVVKEVFKQIDRLKNKGLPLVPISINLSSETFESSDFEKWLVRESSNYNINPKLIQLELTERMILRDINKTIDKFKGIRSKGFKILIDDFGVGYSSLSYLVKLPIDYIKIDRSFIMNLKNGKESKTIVLTLVNMAKELDFDIIAEGIENQEELNYLLEINCSCGQGFYLDRPLSVEYMEKKLKSLSN